MLASGFVISSYYTSVPLQTQRHMVLDGDNLVREHNAKIESIYSVFLAVIVWPLSLSSFNEVMTRVKHAITAEKKKNDEIDEFKPKNRGIHQR